MGNLICASCRACPEIKVKLLFHSFPLSDFAIDVLTDVK